MRSLSSTLLAAQKEASHTPYIKVLAKNQIAGVTRLDWTRLYTGAEADYYHAVTLAGDGSLIRVRIDPPSVSSRKLYRQRVVDPDPSSDYSQWVCTNQYEAVVVACCALGAEVSIFWVKSSREIYQLKSPDYGASWGSPVLLGYTPTTAINGIAAAYKPNGDMALFYADQATLYVMKCLDGSWGSAVAWDKTTGDLSGVAVVYDGDWNLFVTGQDSGGDYKLWSLVYGDGGEVTAVTWSELREFASAPGDGDFEYSQAFMDQPDVYRCFYIEKFAGTQSYNRPYWSYSVVDTGFLSNSWREPVPFNLSSEYGLAVAHHGDYCWLSSPAGVWRASTVAQSLDVSDDVLSLKQETGGMSGKLTVELRNDDGRYAQPGQGALAALGTGCHLELSPGYYTAVGEESSSGLIFTIDAWEHTSSGGKATLVLHASDGWGLVKNWRARYQWRWNRAAEEMSIKDILALVLARAGLKLEVISQSSVMAGFYPDFTINPGNPGELVVSRLLSLVPDVLFVEGHKAYLVNPQSADSSVYSYGTAHAVVEGNYRAGASGLNRVQVEGYDDGAGTPIIVDCFDWAEVGIVYDRLRQLEDNNISTVSSAQARGEAYLRQAAIASVNGVIRVPVNCGQQLYDVIDITDTRAGLAAVRRRVVGITLHFDADRARYEQRLALGAV